MHDTILQSIGRTPLVKLTRVTEGLQAQVAIKVESQNPGGSVKDRVALAMIGDAERRGHLRTASVRSRATSSAITSRRAACSTGRAMTAAIIASAPTARPA